jgi:hypothetical protein
MGLGMELSARRRDGSTFPAEIALSAILEPGVNLIEKPFSEASLLAKLSALASQGG